jgi:RNA polymerase sigma factor (sigma-70 family)
VLDLAVFYQVTPEYLFPEALDHVERNRVEREVGFTEIGHAIAREIGPGEKFDRQETIVRLDDGLSVLSERERFILEERFGVNGGDGATLEEIGRSLGVSRERVRGLEARALRKLGDYLGEPSVQDMIGSFEVAQ